MLGFSRLFGLLVLVFRFFGDGAWLLRNVLLAARIALRFRGWLDWLAALLLELHLLWLGSYMCIFHSSLRLGGFCLDGFRQLGSLVVLLCLLFCCWVLFQSCGGC